MKLVILSLMLTGCASSIKVGDCVRELGHDTIETVITKSEYGAIETEYKSSYNNAIRTEVYGKQQQEKLVKVECK
jgi:hypothetical protein